MIDQKKKKKKKLIFIIELSLLLSFVKNYSARYLDNDSAGNKSYLSFLSRFISCFHFLFAHSSPVLTVIVNVSHDIFIMLQKINTLFHYARRNVFIT